MRKKLTPEERKKQIIFAAIKLFREKGYEQTTVNNIIDEAGISKGGFYHHYDSKEQLLEDVGKIFIKKGLEIIRDISERNDLSALEKTNEYIREFNEMKMQKSHEIFALLSEMYAGGKNQKLEDLTFGYGQKYIAPYMKKIIEQGVEEGEFKTDFPEEAAEVFVRLFILNQQEVAKKFAEILKKKDREVFEKELQKIKRKYLFFQDTLEKMLGLEKDSLILEQVADKTMESFGDVFVRGTNKG